MGWLDDALDFEVFHTKDLWKRLKADPKRLFLGVDPWSTKAWNFALGRDDQPLVDQMGGAYGGHTFSWGAQNQNGGVYERARAAGINTAPGAQAQDLAHTIAAYYALAGGANSAGFGGGGGGGSDYSQYARMGSNLLGGGGGGGQSNMDKLKEAQELWQAIMIAQSQMPQTWSNPYG